MPLYSKRVSDIEVVAPSLHNKEGEPVDSLPLGSKAVIKVGDLHFTFVLSRDGSEVSLQCSEKSGFTKEQTRFRMVL